MSSSDESVEPLASRTDSLEPQGIRRRHRSAWLTSLAFHCVIFVVAGLLVKAAPRGVAEEPGRTTGIVLANVSASETTYYSEADSVVDSQTTQASSAAAVAAAVTESQRPQLPSLDGLLPTVSGGGVGGTSGNGQLPDASSLTESGGYDGAVGRPTTTQVFGVQGTGSRFVYVFDRSASMEGFGGRPLKVAKLELIASLESLRKTNEFQLVFYNERPTLFNPNAGPPTMLFATDQNREEATKFITAVQGRGATRHLEALEIALRMSPDVIFFLTDAAEPQLTEEELDLIDRWNRSATSIHTIEFGVGPRPTAANFLQRIAERNSGQYVYRDVSSFDDP